MYELPSEQRTVRVAGSTSVTSAILTLTVWSLRKMPRSDRATSLDESCAVATW